jgi:multisubunit Na+/H+ antiporter MnhG subunit
MSAVRDVLLWGGVAVAAFAGLGLGVLRRRADRIHLLALVTSLATPLVCASVALDHGWERNTVKVILIGATVAATGAVLTAATGQASYDVGPED